MDIKELKPTNDPISYWGNSVKDTIRKNSTFLNSDFVGDSTPGGTSLELSSKYRYPQQPDTYKYEWNITASYNVGDIVRVMPNHDYLYVDMVNAAGNVVAGSGGAITLLPALTIGPHAGYADGQIFEIVIDAGNWVGAPMVGLYVKPIPGVYRCCFPIPSMFDFLIAIAYGGIPPSQVGALNVLSYKSPPTQFPGYLPYVGADVRFWDVNYFPVWPELPNIAKYNGTDFTGYNGRYWERIGGLPMETPMQICLNGQYSATTIYVDGFQRPTGSYLNATGSFPNVA